MIKHTHFVRFTPALGPVESSSSIAVDGYFGPQTKRLIAAFEADMKSTGKLLVADGIVEPAPSGGVTHSGVLYKIIHLNRAMKDRDGGSSSCHSRRTRTRSCALRWSKAP